MSVMGKGLWSALTGMAESPNGQILENDLIVRLQTLGVGQDTRMEIWKELVGHKLATFTEGKHANTMTITSKGKDLLAQLAGHRDRRR